MPLTKSQEALAQAYVNDGLTQTETYAKVFGAAGLSPQALNSKAQRAFASKDLKDRIVVLREAAAKKAARTGPFDLAAAMRECDEAIELAHAKGQASSAVAAIKLKAQLNGLLIEKKEISTTHSLDESDATELRAMQQALTKEISALRAKQEADAPKPSVAIPLKRVI